MPISYKNSRFPCFDLEESCFTAINVPLGKHPLYTGPNPPSPILLETSKLFVAASICLMAVAGLVGNEKMKASTNVRHIILPCNSTARAQVIPDIIRCYSSGGRTIIFAEKKESASEFAGLLPGARALHGDIQQSQREITLKGFRSGKFLTLVATNVAAKGLDINDVQLIIQCESPRDVEAYIHRSRRTGRAGNTGVAVMHYDPRRSNISKIEREAGIKFEHVSAPQPDEIAKVNGGEAAELISDVSDSVIPSFKAAAEELLNNSGLTAVELLAKALAKAEDKVDGVQGLALTADGQGAIFLMYQSRTWMHFLSVRRMLSM
ncbi:DEAD-box ATP-dependent RNA helicase 7 [Lathyrus oleraceus]|uniref:DEAD-box ATP-dependent RNA helicase 7 n=1 Tax=Pisum sativum TaxID=3888 RepID=UPI0021D0C9C8|nr:DEAD-box ATP-dependent RNA helicase 7-like [Pisum sativum]